MNKVILVLSVIILVGSGCDSSRVDDTQTSLSISLPSTDRQISATVDQVYPVVAINGSRAVAQRIGGNYIVTYADDFEVSAETFLLNLNVEWRDIATDIIVASTGREIEVFPGGTYVIDSYNTNFDFDNDGLSNLTELNNGTPINGAGDTDGDDTGTVGGEPLVGDANGNGIPDAFETSSNSNDANGNGIIDLYELPAGTLGARDNNDNGVDDSFEVALTGGSDVDNDGVDDSAAAALADRLRVQVDVDIPRINASSPPQIDGVLDSAWDGAVTLDNSGNRLWIDHLIFDSTGTQNDLGPTHNWRAMHDGTHLYLFVEVVSSANIYYGNSRITDDSGVEFFIDGNNSKGNTFDGIDDTQFIASLVRSTGQARQENGINAATDVDALSFWNATVDAAGIFLGYAIETRIRLANANINWNEPFGLEIQINENYDGGARDAKWGWSVDSFAPDVAYQNPSVFGTAILR